MVTQGISVLTRCLKVCRGLRISHQLLGVEVFACEAQHVVEHGFHFIQLVHWIGPVSKKSFSNSNFIDWRAQISDTCLCNRMSLPNIHRSIYPLYRSKSLPRRLLEAEGVKR